ncbi:MAG: protein kinase [bacterium]|nr:protein kinase [bacterium]
MSKTTCPMCHFVNSSDRQTCGRCGALLSDARSSDRLKAPQSGRRNTTSLRRGQVVAGRYKVLDMIGRGGMGAIYLVQDNTLHERVALKTLLPQFAQDKMVVERFYNEARIARQLSHPNIVRVHDIGVADEVMYISMEHLKGRSLRNLLDQLPPGGRMPVKTTLSVIDQLCAGLEYAHDFTIHRDIKPENVMVMEDGSVKLMDFGISKLMTNTKMTSTSVVMGTPHYMSPEQLKDSSNVDVRADVYSVGVMLYEILAGNLPTGVPKPASQIMQDVPPALDPIVVKCLEPDPIDRYQTVTDLREALRPVREVLEKGTSLSMAAAGQGAEDGVGWGRPILGVVLAAVVALVSGVGLWQLHQRREALVQTARHASDRAQDPAAAQARQLRQLMEDVGQARAEAEGAAQEHPERQDALAAAVRAHDAADAAAAAQTEDAWEQAQRVLLTYDLVANPPEGMAFIPAGEGTGPFLIDEWPVSLQAFRAFGEAMEWRPEMATAAITEGRMDGPVTGVCFYDAQAYAAWADKSLPTVDQWVHAIEMRPDLIVAGLCEWTRTGYGGLDEEDEDGVPALPFGSPVQICMAMVAESNETQDEEDAEPAPPVVEVGTWDYGSQRADLGFRCVLEFPLTR